MGNSLPHICFVALNAYPVLLGADSIEFVGGAEVQQVLVARALVSRGYQVSMICWDFGQQEQVVIDGIRVFKACRPTEGLRGLRFVWPRLTSFWRCLHDADADIYYQRTASMLTGVVAAFTRRHDRKSVFAAAGNPDLELRTPRIDNARDRLIYEYGLKRVDRILVQNQEQARLCQENFGREAKLVPNCYPMRPDVRAEAAQIVLWVATVRRIKRPELFLALAELLPQCRFRMIGGPDGAARDLFAEVKARASRLPNLEFLGFRPFGEVEEHFDRAAVFVNTSESEGFPNTFLQAWARGVPTVSFIDCGARMNGQLVGAQVDSVQAMAGRLKYWLENEDAREKEGALCRDYFLRHHSPEQVLDLYEEVFGDLMGRGR